MRRGRSARPAAKETALLVELVKQNTQLTETVKSLTKRVEALTLEVHKAVVIRIEQGQQQAEEPMVCMTHRWREMDSNL
jgi:hypothetical protein